MTRRPARLLATALLVLVLAADADARPWSWLGVRIRDLSEQEMDELARRHGIREGFGVVIVEVLADTPAAQAGLRNGDIVVALEGRPVTETRLLQRLIAAAPVGRETRLTVLRAEGRHPVRVNLVAMPPAQVGERVAVEFGFVLREPDGPQGELAGRRLGPASPAIAVVIRGGPAERAGLLAGDVILQVDDRAVLTLDAAREALADVGIERPLRLTIRRGEERLALTLPPAAGAR
ncbi:MAG TPA: PDZ domain-containing protein [Methylomirabilota bacterium]|nr:PDZ domain-containing protein [Methylomirabilota bacterium]